MTAERRREVVEATPGRVGALAHVFGRAFVEEPMTLWSFGEHGDVEARLTSAFSCFLEKRHDPAFGPGQNWRLSIYEVSTCPKGLVCLPGYRNYVHNMKPALLFDFHAYGAKKHHGVLPSSFTKLFVVPYDPNAWTEAQPDVAGLR